MRLVLIGFMGSGKSSVGRALATKLGVKLVDLDIETLKLSGKSSITEIFTESGEKYFRELESKACAETKNLQDVVIASGGGVITRQDNMQTLKANKTKIIFLRTKFHTIVERLRGVSDLPLFTSLEQGLNLFNERASIYQKYADLIIDTDEDDIAAVAGKILQAL